MKCLRLSILVCMVFAVACLATARAAEPSAAPKIRVLLTYGGHAFEEPLFYAMFDALPNVVYRKAQMPQEADLLKPGLEKDFDVIVMYDLVRPTTPITAEQQKAFAALLKKGIGLVSLHHNMAAHNDWSEFAKIIGAKYFLNDCEFDGKSYSRSGWIHGQDMKITVADKEHPITRGLKDFEIHDEAYSHYYVAPSSHVLLTTDHPKNDRQIAWVTQYGASRVFYFMLGHDHLAWQNPNYSEILLRGIHWAAGK
jgi:uncharacterized protein